MRSMSTSRLVDERLTCRTPHAHAPPRALEFGPAVEACSAERARPVPLGVHPMVWSTEPAARRVARPVPHRMANQRDAHVDQLDESADRPDRLVRRDAGDERHLDGVDVPEPGDVALLEERGGNGDLGLTHEPAGDHVQIRRRRSRRGQGRGGRRSATRRRSPRPSGWARRRRSAAHLRTTARAVSGTAGHRNADRRRTSRRGAGERATVRPSSKRMSKCLPTASAPTSTAPVRSTPTSRGSRVTQRTTCCPARRALIRSASRRIESPSAMTTRFAARRHRRRSQGSSGDDARRER